MTRLALCLEYDGSDFYGWQFQNPKLRTVQSVVENALSKVANVPIQVVCAGRTDKGVHARNQVIHFDTTVNRPLKAWVLGTNSHLPRDVVVKCAKQVSDDFHARFSAIARHYRYYISDNPIRPAIKRRYLSWNYDKLNEEAMHQAGQCLIGEHDFSSFRAAGCQSRTPFRNVTTIQVYRDKRNLVIDIEANAFLHHMVRNIVGVLILVGEGRKPINWVGEVLQARDRRAAGITAPPNGLFLVDVVYPNGFGLQS